MKNRIHSVLIIAAVPFFIAGCERTVSFKEDIRPILNTSCLKCHDGEAEGSAASGFSVQTYESLMKGTNYGAVVVPGSAVSSTLYRLVSHEADPKIQMPPQHKEALAQGRGTSLDDTQIENIKLWIDQGAKNN